jgi:two-component sensor histidine kinase
MLDIDTAIPLGIIINELITNSLKYAFPGGREGNLSVSLKENNAKMELKVLDDGIGLDEVEPSNISFGMKLLNAFKSKLNAEIFIDGKKGTEVIYSIGSYKRA